MERWLSCFYFLLLFFGGSVTFGMSNFTCGGRPPGYYADIDLNCEVYHLCNRHGVGMAFECPAKTAFQQRTMVCDHASVVDCKLSEKYFDSNLKIGRRNSRLIDDDDDDKVHHHHHHPVYMKLLIKTRRKTRPSRIGGKMMQLVIKKKRLTTKRRKFLLFDNSSDFLSNQFRHQRRISSSSNFNSVVEPFSIQPRGGVDGRFKFGFLPLTTTDPFLFTTTTTAKPTSVAASSKLTNNPPFVWQDMRKYFFIP